MAARDAILTCDTLSHNQPLKGVQRAEKRAFENEQKSDTIVVLPTSRLQRNITTV